MGISSIPSPSDGVVNVLVGNTVLTIYMFKCFVRLLLGIVGIRLPPPPSVFIDNFSQLGSSNLGSSSSHIVMFRKRYPAIRFDKVQGPERCEHDCSVCLTQFEPESEINHLPCGHLFHTKCFEKWLDYWNITCPLCRTRLVFEEKWCFW